MGKALKRDKKGRLVKGTPPGPGRNKETEADKIQKKATTDVIKEYKESLADALPKLSPVLIKKASKGDMSALKEVNDRVMGKAPQPQEHSGEINFLILPATLINKNDTSPIPGNSSSE